jgi:glycosyltransferase involved in cell wall biosynthesis
MRILITAAYREIIGGAETYLRALLPFLTARGHEVAVLYERAESAGRETIDGRVAGLTAWCVETAGLDAALRDADRWRPDAAYVQGHESPAVEEAVAGRFPAVLFAHNYHGTCISGTKRHALPSARPCIRRFGWGCVVRYYPCRCGGLDPRTLWRLYGLQRRRRALLPRYRAVAVSSQHMVEEYRRHGVPEDRLHLLPYFTPGLETDPGPPPPRLHVAGSPADRVLMVGRLTDLKGGVILTEAVRQAQALLSRPLHLTVAGDGPERPAMEAAAARAGLRAAFTGWVGAARRAELMREADLLAVPSVWPEPFGLVGVEAGRVGLPAAAFDVGGVRDWLRPGASGELAPGDPPTANGLAAAINRALADPERLNRLRAGAWEVARGFTPEKHLDGLERILNASRAGVGGGAA